MGSQQSLSDVHSRQSPVDGGVGRGVWGVGWVVWGGGGVGVWGGGGDGGLVEGGDGGLVEGGDGSGLVECVWEPSVCGKGEDEDVVGAPVPVCHIPSPPNAPSTAHRGGSGVSPDDFFWAN